MAQKLIIANNKTLTSRSIPSLIKWTGSKRSQASAIFKLRLNYERYVEPFLGGGAMLYMFAHPKAIGNDIYAPLIDLWKLVRDHPNELISDYQNKWKILNKELDRVILP